MAAPQFPQSRSKAARVRTLAQLGALIAAVAAGAAITTNFVAASGKEAPAAVAVRPLDPKKWAPPADTNQAKADLEGIGTRMMLVSNSPKIVEAPKVDPTAPPVLPPASVKDHVKFLGIVADGARLFALIAVDGKQRIVSIGDVLKYSGDGTATVSAITSDSVTLDDGKKPETIELAHRLSSAVGHSNAPPTALPAPVNVNGIGKNGNPADRRGGPSRAKPLKDPMSALDPKTRALIEETNARSMQDAREMRRKAARIELEKKTGRSGEEIEKLLDQEEQAGKLDVNFKEVESKGKGGK